MSLSTSVTHLVGRMPFAGKRHIAALHHAGFQAARRGDYETARYCNDRLTNESVVHSFAAFIGAVVMGINTYNSFRYGGAVYPAEALYDALFASVNVGTAYVQGRMASNVDRAITNHAPIPALDTPVEAPSFDYDIRPSIGQRAVNTLGYLAFGVTAVHGTISTAGVAII